MNRELHQVRRACLVKVIKQLIEERKKMDIMEVFDREINDPKTDPGLVETLKAHRSRQIEMRAAAMEGHEALTRLAPVLGGRSGQPYKIRELLFSLWNGKPAELNEVLGLDWELRQDMCRVILGWGYEDKQIKFFYKAMEAEIRKAGQWEWFLEESENIKKLKAYVESAERAERYRNEEA